MIDRGTGGAEPRNTRRATPLVAAGSRTATPIAPKKTQKNPVKLSANAEVLRRPLGTTTKQGGR